jgi:hypothetical protein
LTTRPSKLLRLVFQKTGHGGVIRSLRTQRVWQERRQARVVLVGVNDYEVPSLLGSTAPHPAPLGTFAHAAAAEQEVQHPSHLDASSKGL